MPLKTRLYLVGVLSLGYVYVDHDLAEGMSLISIQCGYNGHFKGRGSDWVQSSWRHYLVRTFASLRYSFLTNGFILQYLLHPILGPVSLLTFNHVR